MARLESFNAGSPRGGGGAGYTAFVRLLKVLLPVAAIVIVGVVVAKMSQNPIQQVETAVTQKEKTTPGQIEVTGARYEGADADGRPYTLIADLAERVEGTEESVRLEGLRADATLKDGSWVSVTAKTGMYAVTGQTIALAGGVTVYHDSGIEAKLDHIDIDMKNRAAMAETPVSAVSSMGEIQANGFETFDQGERVVFTGPVRLTIYHMGKRG